MLPETIENFEHLYGPFTRLAVRDKAIFYRYLLQGGYANAPFRFDVRVGSGIEMPASATPTELIIATALTTKRIDVLHESESETVIYEVKHYAGLSAVGQLLGYKILYAQDNPNTPPIRLVLITDKIQPDMLNFLADHNIELHEVGN